MNLKNFTDGIAIISRYYEKQDGYHIGAEHDTFYMYATDRPIPPPDVEALHKLGWFQEGVDEYDPAEGWCTFV